MNIKDISTQLELVRECYHRVSSAHNFWIAYRRAVRYLRSKGLNPLTDEELFGLPDLPEAVANGPFDDEKDIAFFDAPCPMRAVRPGQCIVIEPLVAHAPCHTDEPGTRLRKAIVKVLF